MANATNAARASKKVKLLLGLHPQDMIAAKSSESFDSRIQYCLQKKFLSLQKNLATKLYNVFERKNRSSLLVSDKFVREMFLFHVTCKSLFFMSLFNTFKSHTIITNQYKKYNEISQRCYS